MKKRYFLLAFLIVFSVAFAINSHDVAAQSSKSCCSSFFGFLYNCDDSLCSLGEVCNEDTGLCESVGPNCPGDLGPCTSTTTCAEQTCGGVSYWCRDPFGWVQANDPAISCSSSSDWCKAVSCGGNTFYCLSDNTWAQCSDGCTNGQCSTISTDPCEGVICSSPPDDECSGNNLVKYSSSGTCNQGSCSYSSSTTSCTYGCVIQSGDDRCATVCEDTDGICPTTGCSESNDADCQLFLNACESESPNPDQTKLASTSTECTFGVDNPDPDSSTSFAGETTYKFTLDSGGYFADSSANNQDAIKLLPTNECTKRVELLRVGLDDESSGIWRSSNNNLYWNGWNGCTCDLNKYSGDGCAQIFTVNNRIFDYDTTGETEITLNSRNDCRYDGAGLNQQIWAEFRVTYGSQGNYEWDPAKFSPSDPGLACNLACGGLNQECCSASPSCEFDSTLGQLWCTSENRCCGNGNFWDEAKGECTEHSACSPTTAPENLNACDLNSQVCCPDITQISPSEFESECVSQSNYIQVY